MHTVDREHFLVHIVRTLIAPYRVTMKIPCHIISVSHHHQATILMRCRIIGASCLCGAEYSNEIPRNALFAAAAAATASAADAAVAAAAVSATIVTLLTVKQRFSFSRLGTTQKRSTPTRSHTQQRPMLPAAAGNPPAEHTSKQPNQLQSRLLPRTPFPPPSTMIT